MRSHLVLLSFRLSLGVTMLNSRLVSSPSLVRDWVTWYCKVHGSTGVVFVKGKPGKEKLPVAFGCWSALARERRERREKRVSDERERVLVIMFSRVLTKST